MNISLSQRICLKRVEKNDVGTYSPIMSLFERKYTLSLNINNLIRTFKCSNKNLSVNNRKQVQIMINMCET